MSFLLEEGWVAREKLVHSATELPLTEGGFFWSKNMAEARLNTQERTAVVVEANGRLNLGSIRWHAEKVAKDNSTEVLAIVPSAPALRHFYFEEGENPVVRMGYYPDIQSIFEQEVGERISNAWKDIYTGVQYLLSPSYSFEVGDYANREHARQVYVAGMKLSAALPNSIRIILPPSIAFAYADEANLNYETSPFQDGEKIPFIYNIWKPPTSQDLIDQSRQVPDIIPFWYSIRTPQHGKLHIAKLTLDSKEAGLL